jgi:hypothetical protein
MEIHPKIKVLALTPFFFGNTGGPVNERQFLLSLANKVDALIIVTLIPFRQFFTERKRLLRKINQLSSLTLICLPDLPSVLSLFFQILVSLLFAPVALFLKMSNKLDMVYVREAWLSIGFTLIDSLREITVIKIPSALEGQEGAKTNIVTFLLYRFVAVRSKYIATYSDILVDKLKKKLGVEDRLFLILPPGVNQIGRASCRERV